MLECMLIELHLFFCSLYCRILEMKNEMVNLELLEFHYFDDILTDMKLTPVSAHPPTHTASA